MLIWEKERQSKGSGTSLECRRTGFNTVLYYRLFLGLSKITVPLSLSILSPTSVKMGINNTSLPHKGFVKIKIMRWILY